MGCGKSSEANYDYVAFLEAVQDDQMETFKEIYSALKEPKKALTMTDSEGRTALHIVNKFLFIEL